MVFLAWMNKNVAIVVGILILIIVGFAAYSVMKKPSQPINKVIVTSENKSAASNSQTAQGTLKSLLSSDKSQKCTYSYDRQSTAFSGTVYVAKGKMKGDFDSTSGQSKVAGHMIVDNGYFYIWTDLSNRGIKMAVNQEQSANVPVSNSQAPDINQSFNYTCQAWTEDDTLFALPSGISFMITTLPAVPSSAGVSTPSGVETTNPSAYCSACDKFPAGSGRDACRTQLHCQ